METPLDKARAALEAAKPLLEAEHDKNGMLPLREADEFTRLLQMANVQINLAHAEATVRIADWLDQIVPHKWYDLLGSISMALNTRGAR